jgi:signal transduction histidine kinase
MAAYDTMGRSTTTGRDRRGKRPFGEILHALGRVVHALSLVDMRGAREAQERWDLAAAAAAFGIFEWDIRTDEVTLDARAAALFGCAADGERVVSHRGELRKHVHEDDRARLRTTVEGAAADGRRFTVRCRVRGPDGELRHVQVVGRLACGKGGARVVGLVRDVSGEELQGQLAMQRDSALAVAKARMDFVSRLSHELRTPLNAIVGFAELMTLDADNVLPEPQAHRLRHVVEASRQLRTLVDEMLDLSKIDAGAIPVSVRLIDAGAILRSAAALVEPLARQSGVQLENHLDERPLLVYADPQRLQQVFVNLLTNGCKYNRRGGELVFASEWEARGLVVRFADTGIGIAPQDLAELGRPFRRVGAQGSQVAGTGLGLYIVKLILERMGGALEVRSAPGLGSIFSVVLPIRPPVVS